MHIAHKLGFTYSIAQSMTDGLVAKHIHSSYLLLVCNISCELTTAYGNFGALSNSVYNNLLIYT